ncbi:uncharacterized protein RAG0_05685 [Rhynchosporium agropyri]|uniref:Ankyrin n=1 Tax=Rhynchosporium agropyri TaxID=914238 RepID=A0A1E1KE16_9HELO|nr:uncharacterized protein RAG0_05685 [Rhynchosporium agropyri]
MAANNVLAMRDLATELVSLPGRKQGFVLQALTLWHRVAALVLLDLLGDPAELDHTQTKISAIHKVCECGDEGLFDILLEKEANNNYSRGRNEPDVLTVAIQYGHLSMARGLFNNLNYDTRNSYATCGKKKVLLPRPRQLAL